MARQTIAVDIDDVLVDHYEALVEFHNGKYGTAHTVDDYISDHWSLVWGTDKEETERRAREFAELGVANRKLKAGARDALQALHQRYDLAIVTVRRKVNVEPTLAWVADELPGLFKDVRFVPIWEDANTPTKAAICQELGADYLIDDSLKHCTIAAEVGLHAVLFGNYAWNRADALPANVTRCHDWAAVAEYFAHEQ